jgi:GGDEF domain-containing protein
MRLSMMTERTLPLRRMAVATVWLAATVTLASTLRSPLAILVLTAAVVALMGVYRRFDSHRGGMFHAGRDLRSNAGGAGMETSFAQHFVAKEFAAAQRGRELTLVMFGLSRLEEFREQNGAGAAAEALREFGRVLQQMTRQMNLSSRCGWRADAFLSVLADADAAAAEAFIARVRKAVAASTVPMPDVEAGIAVYQPHLASPEEFVECAERALAAARATAGAARRPRREAPAYGARARQLQTG